MPSLSSWLIFAYFCNTFWWNLDLILLDYKLMTSPWYVCNIVHTKQKSDQNNKIHLKHTHREFITIIKTLMHCHAVPVLYRSEQKIQRKIVICQVRCGTQSPDYLSLTNVHSSLTDVPNGMSLTLVVPRCQAQCSVVQMFWINVNYLNVLGFEGEQPSWWMDNGNVVHTCDGILFSCEKNKIMKLDK